MTLSFALCRPQAWDSLTQPEQCSSLYGGAGVLLSPIFAPLNRLAIGFTTLRATSARFR